MKHLWNTLKQIEEDCETCIFSPVGIMIGAPVMVFFLIALALWD